MSSSNNFDSIVYYIVHNSQRTEKIFKQKSQDLNHRGYDGKRYNKTTQKQKKYWTMSSVYMRHQEISKKYEYDFDPEGNRVLIYLKQKWSQLLFKYLGMFGSGYFIKKKSSKDKMKFKQQSDFKLKINPLSQMVGILDKFNYAMIVFKIFNAFERIRSEELKYSQLVLKRQESGQQEEANLSQNDEDSLLQGKQSIINSSQDVELASQIESLKFSQNSFNNGQIAIKKSKLMKFYDFYKQEGCRGRRFRIDLYKIQRKRRLMIRRNCRKPITKFTVEKIAVQFEKFEKLDI